MIGTCLSAKNGLAVPLLETLDCELNAYIAGSYDTLFGQAGWLAPVLTSALTIYVGFFALSLITGRANLSLSGLVPRLAVIALVLTFATRWGAYQEVLVNLLFDGAAEIAGQMTAERGGEGGVAARLDRTLENIAQLAGSEEGITGVGGVLRPRTVREAAMAAAAESPLADRTQQGVGGMRANLLWTSAAVLACGSAGLLVLSKVLLSVLLAVGPLFVVFGLFSATRGLLEGWLKTSALYALVPLFVLVLTAGVLQVAEPLIAGISEARATGGDDMRPTLMLAAVCLVFAALMVQVFRLVSGLTGSWRLDGLGGGTARADTHAQAAAPSATAAPAEPRLAQMLSSVERLSHQTSVPAPAMRTDFASPLGGGHTAPYRPGRRPLGQSLRMGAARGRPSQKGTA